MDKISIICLTILLILCIISITISIKNYKNIDHYYNTDCITRCQQTACDSLNTDLYCNENCIRVCNGERAVGKYPNMSKGIF